MIGFRIAIIAVLASVLVPMLIDRTFHPLEPAGLVFFGLIALYTYLMTHGVSLARRLLPHRWAAPYFTLHLLLSAAAYALPIPHDTIWILAMPVVSLATGMISITGAAAVTAGSLLVFGVFLHLVGAPAARVFSAVLSLSVGMVFTVSCTLLALWANRSREEAERLARELEQANAELRASAERTAALAAAQERNRIARDIHDGLGHYLTVVAVQLQAARALLESQPGRAAEALEKAEQSARAALADVRRSVGALRDDAGRLPLRAALKGLIGESGLAASFTEAGAPRPLPEPAEQALFRAVQEALTNVRKHAAAARVGVLLDFRDAARVAVEISDDGRGCGAAAPVGGFGLAGLRERLAAVGGTLAAANGVAGGFVVRAEVPA